VLLLTVKHATGCFLHATTTKSVKAKNDKYLIVFIGFMFNVDKPLNITK
jgi:hypothetical protein